MLYGSGPNQTEYYTDSDYSASPRSCGRVGRVGHWVDKIANRAEWVKSTQANIAGGVIQITNGTVETLITGQATDVISDQFTLHCGFSSSHQASSFNTKSAVWMWMVNITDNCGQVTVNMSTWDVLTTPTPSWPPCCVPGFASVRGDNHGPCSADSQGKIIDFCARSSSSLVV